MRGAVEGRAIRLERGLALFGAELAKVRLMAELAEQQEQQVLQAIARPAPSCSATLHVTVTDACSGAALSGVALTATGPGTTVTGTTNGSGLADLVVGAAGSWTISGTKTTYTTSSAAATATCGATTNVALPLTVTGQVTSRTVNVKGCGNLNVPGVTVNLIRSGVTLATGTTDSSGNITFSGLTAGSGYTVQASKTRFNSATSSAFSVTCGSTTPGISFTLTAATGWRCNTACPDPLPATLTVTDPILGTFNLVSANPATNHAGCAATGAITGVRTATFCTASGTSLSVPVRISLVGSGGIAQLQIDIKACDILSNGGSLPEGAAQNGTCPITGSPNVDFWSYLVTLSVASCVPFSASGSRSFALNGGSTTPGTTVYGTGVSRTWTITE